ncbi:protein FAR1-RELATED SEQUENCE 5-like [Chenopodium quinoa]|uniref:protein FAR1-RELATED SEQUENCE 5-like n=1 Tax=Chenopodium quinoa TaxID=63459 RepID=UPI000B7855F5|nr:protein FAR1-RELATED SEQUENCE 5-like [Chenopodium quinoa]
MSRRRSAFISEALGGDDEPSTPSSQDPIEDFGGDGVNYYPHFQTDQLFPTYRELSQWAKDIALTLKFQLVISYNHNGWLYLRCNRGARDRGKNRDLSVAQRPKTKTQHCGCKFLIKGYKVSDDEGWQIVLGPDAYGKHNHELIVYEEGNRQMSKLSPGAKQLVRDLTDAKVKPQNILAAVRNQFPDDHPNRRHIYNFRDRLRLEDADGRAAVTYFLELSIESQYTHWSLVDPDTNVLTHVFMAHPTSLALLRTYPWVIGIDSTYKTNKYKMPFLELVGVTPCNMNFLIGYAFMKDESAVSYAWVIDKLKLLI